MLNFLLTSPRYKLFMFAFFTLMFSFLALSQENTQKKSISAQLDEIISSSKDAEQDVVALMPFASKEEKTLIKLKLASIYRKSSQHEDAELVLAELSKKLSLYNNELKIRVLREIAQMARSQNDYAKAATIMETQVLPLAIPESEQLGEIYKITGLYFRQQMQLDKAKHYYLLALDHFNLVNDRGGEARVYASLGVLYETLGDLVLAAEYQTKAMHYFEEHNEVSELATNYFNLGEIYYDSEDLEQSMKFYRKALSYDQQLNEMENTGYDYHRIGSIYLKQKNYAKALEYTEKAIVVFSEHKADQVLSRAYVQQANIYAGIDENQNRFDSLVLARKFAEKTPTDHQLRSVWSSIGRYYLETKELALAKGYAERALSISNKLLIGTYQQEDNSLLAQIHQALTNYESAYKHLQASSALQEKLNSEQRIVEVEKRKRDISLLEEQIKLAKSEKALLKTEDEVILYKAMNQRNIIIFIFFVVVFSFITFLVHQRRKMAMLKAKLYEETLAQKNQFLADVSHELRTPLTALKLQIDALRYNLSEDVELSYQKLSTKVMDLNRLIGDIYELAISDNVNMNCNFLRCDFIPILNSWDREFAQIVEANDMEWRFKCTSPSAYTNVDIERIKQVLLNLISNSINYSDKPGVVQLSAKIKDEELILIVKDSGPGVKDEELKKIFERLYRVEKSRNRQTGGSGLGLAISYNIIRAHNGEIFAKSSNLGGLAIIIKFPLDSA